LFYYYIVASVCRFLCLWPTWYLESV